MIQREAKYRIGQVVRHRFHPFRGVVFDVDPTMNNAEEWWLAIPEDVRPLDALPPENEDRLADHGGHENENRQTNRAQGNAPSKPRLLPAVRQRDKQHKAHAKTP